MTAASSVLLLRLLSASKLRRRRFMRGVVGGLCVLITADPAAAQTGEDFPQVDISRPLVERQPLVIGAPNDGFPYGYVAPDGSATGFAVEILDAVLQAMELRSRRELMPGRECHERFRAGQIDILQTNSKSAVREAYTDFSVPYLTMEAVIFVRKSGPKFRRIAELDGLDFAFISQTAEGEMFMRARGAIVKPVIVSSAEEGLRLVNSGECVGIFVSRLTAMTIIEKNGLDDLMIFDGEPARVSFQHSFAVHKGDAQLLARLNEGLAIIHRSGRYEEIYRKWFGRFDRPQFTREQVARYVALALALAFIAAVWGLLRQRALRKRIGAQAEELAEKEALLQALYDNIPMAMAVIEAVPDGHRLLSVNREAEAYFGSAAKLAVGQRLDALTMNREWSTHLTDLLNRWPPIGSLVREERRLSAQKRLVLTLVPLAPGHDGYPRVCVLAEDVTERRQLDEEIAQSRKLRAVGELVGGIAHEFNNLLTPVMLKVGQIELEWDHDERLQREIGVIQQAAARAAELTRRLLMFGRKGESRAEAVQLRTLVTSCFELLRQTVDRRIAWENRVSADLPPLFLNATDLNQVLLNLLLNARDTLMEKVASHHGDWTPCIDVRAAQLPADALEAGGTINPRLVQSWQCLTIRDNGMGMTPEVRERIFEPFYTTKEVGRGTGLGLATVWHVVTQIGGRVEVDSSPGHGTSFHVFLPVLSPPPTRRSPPPAVAVARARDLKIFLVEDEALVADTVTATLERAGHSVTRRANGMEAWQHLQEHVRDYDVLIFDINMPGIDGLELARRVRGAGEFAGRLVVVSGRLSSAELESIRQVRVDHVLPKPFTADEVLAAVSPQPAALAH